MGVAELAMASTMRRMVADSGFVGFQRQNVAQTSNEATMRIPQVTMEVFDTPINGKRTMLVRMLQRNDPIVE